MQVREEVRGRQEGDRGRGGGAEEALLRHPRAGAHPGKALSWRLNPEEIMRGMRCPTVVCLAWWRCAAPPCCCAPAARLLPSPAALNCKHRTQPPPRRTCLPAGPQGAHRSEEGAPDGDPGQRSTACMSCHVAQHRASLARLLSCPSRPSLQPRCCLLPRLPPPTKNRSKPRYRCCCCCSPWPAALPPARAPG